jgi:ketosteroid isomerase-like protein
MRPTAIVRASALLVLLALPATAVHAQQLSAAGDVAIRRHVRELVDATNHNPMATLQKYVQSAEVTSINDETIVRGWSSLVQQTQGAAAGSFFLQLGDVSLVGMGSQAALAIAPFTMSYRTADGPVQVPGSMTLAFSWTSDGWKIVHEHYSTGLDERSRQRLSQAAASGGGLTFGDLANLVMTALGGGGTWEAALQLVQTLMSDNCRN